MQLTIRVEWRRLGLGGRPVPSPPRHGPGRV